MTNTINLTVEVVSSRKTIVLVRGGVNLPLVPPVSEGFEKKNIKGNVKIKVNGVPIANGNFEGEVRAVVFTNDKADTSTKKERYNFYSKSVRMV